MRSGREEIQKNWFLQKIVVGRVVIDMVNIELYNDLRNCAGDTVNLIQDDSEFAEAEFELFREWFKVKGFSEFDARYVEACGYDLDLFYEDYEEGR